MSVTNKGLETADKAMSFDHGHAQAVEVGAFTISRFTFEPGWRWSSDVKPIVKTDSCQVHHVGFLLSGRLHVATDDGREAEISPGDAYEIQPGHDGWVIGDESVISVEFSPPKTSAATG
jgi:hypothetical protein